MRAGLERLRRQVADERGGRVILLSHCLLNHNVRYLGGAERQAGVEDLVAAYLADGVGICQLPCPEQRAWGGVLKRRMLLVYGAGGTWRSPLVRALLPAFLACTRLAYRRLGRQVTADVADYQRSGLHVEGFIGIAGSPSCGVHTTLDLPGAADVLRRCPLAQLDRATVTELAVGAHIRRGQGLFVNALCRRFARRGIRVPFAEYDFAARRLSPRLVVDP